MEQRKRKHNKKSPAKHVTFNDDGQYNNNNAQKYYKQQSWVKCSKLYWVIFGFMLLVVANMFWPAPMLSQQAMYWRDSGYHFQYKNHLIFYQHIFNLDKQVLHHPVLLLLHGFPTSSYDWNITLPALHKRFPSILLPDFLGLGFSDKPAPYEYTVTEQADIIESLLEALNISNVHVLAHDLGDTIAQELLARQQSLKYQMKFAIKSLCLTNGGILPSHHRPRPIQKLFLLPGFAQVFSHVMNRFIFYSRFSAVFGSDTQPTNEQLFEYYSIFAFNEGHRAFSHVLQYIPERHRNENKWVGAIKHTKIPLHLIYGPLDPVNTPDGFLTHYKELIPHSSISVLDNVGHYPHVEDHKSFLKSYNVFLDRIKKDYYPLYT